MEKRVNWLNLWIVIVIMFALTLFLSMLGVSEGEIAFTCFVAGIVTYQFAPFLEDGDGFYR